MTYAAFGLHRQLIEEEGFDPTSDEYYTELDKRIRTEFPQKFKGTKRGDSDPESLLRSLVLLKHRQVRGAEQSN
jgi:hypothetical protein